MLDKLRARPDPALAGRCGRVSHCGGKSDEKGLHDAWITKLERVENAELYKNFQLQQLRLQHTVNKGKGGPVLMAEAWHGTGNFDAKHICEDRQAGFLIQYAHSGQA